ncbi:MAG: hypothetical protein K6T65_14065 [Peptococcaceae bacterium]|nr:hypothetical protein [Peptococcaceae bacterium]
MPLFSPYTYFAALHSTIPERRLPPSALVRTSSSDSSRATSPLFWL